MQQSGSCLFTSTVTTCDDIVFTILDDFNNEMDETFNILLTSSDTDACQVVNDNVTVTIMDDGRIRQCLNWLNSFNSNDRLLNGTIVI